MAKVHEVMVCSGSGDTAAQGLLQPGDQLIAVNDIALCGLNHFDAWNLLKTLPNGPVHFTIRRLANATQM